MGALLYPFDAATIRSIQVSVKQTYAKLVKLDKSPLSHDPENDMKNSMMSTDTTSNDTPSNDIMNNDITSCVKMSNNTKNTRLYTGIDKNMTT